MILLVFFRASRYYKFFFSYVNIRNILAG